MTRGASIGLMVTAVVLAVPTTAAAQAWRTVRLARQAHASESLRVRLDYAAGDLRLAGTESAMLYDARMEYDAEQFEPSYRYDAGTHTLTLSLGTPRRGILGLPSGSEGRAAELSLSLRRGVALDLGLRLGAAEAELDLAGLAVDRLTIESRMSEARLRFPTPNPRRLRELEFDVGAAGITASGLGNANVERIELDGGVGGATLDFSGAWAANVSARVRVLAGSITLRVPRDVGISVRLDKVLARFDRSGFTERGGVFHSSNWDTATRQLSVDADITLGELKIERID